MEDLIEKMESVLSDDTKLRLDNFIDGKDRDGEQIKGIPALTSSYTSLCNMLYIELGNRASVLLELKVNPVFNDLAQANCREM